jgi:hypothetical protein
VTETVRDKQNELIKVAEPPSDPKEESSEDIEEAELVEAWDLDEQTMFQQNACQNTRRKMGALSKQILLDRKFL